MSASAPPRLPIPSLNDLPLVIDTARLKLRPLVDTDVDALFEHARDPKLSALLSWSVHEDRSVTKAFVDSQIEARHKGTDLVWAIEHDGKAAGCIGLHGIRWTLRAWRIDRAELGYWLGIPLWGQGYMSEAATAATRWAFEMLGLHKLTIGCIDGNTASKKIIEKIGYRFLCKLEDDVWRDARWWDHLRYELTAAEWADTSRTMRFNRPRQGSQE